MSVYNKYSRLWLLNGHMRVHSREKPYGILEFRLLFLIFFVNLKLPACDTQVVQFGY